MKSIVSFATVERNLSKFYEKEYVLLTGNATAGIYLTLKALGLENKKVAMPNNVCINVPMAIKFSGNLPVYLDIAADSLGLSTASLQKNIREADALIAVHNYGSTCEIQEIKIICENNSIPLIEDFAVAQGATLGNKPVGSFGDISIVSFGAGKIIDSGHGGAILTNDKEIYSKIIKIEKQFVNCSKENLERINQFSKHYKHIYNKFYYGRDMTKPVLAFQEIIKNMKNVFLFKFDNDFRPAIFDGLKNLESNIRSRYEKAQKIKERLKNLSCHQLRVFEPSHGSVYWRFNIFNENNRDSLIKFL
jgi:dTDP-4-amino-4,6-dideoxygalactose transaminase